MALTQALRLAEGKAINIYTDSRYAFATAHIHGAIYKQRGLLTSAGRDIKNKEEILALLEAVHLPKKVAIIHCPSHQKGKNPIVKGNQMADLVAKQVAQQVTILPTKGGISYVQRLHQLTHLGADKLKQFFKTSKYHVLNLNSAIKQVVDSCQACALTNAARPYQEPRKRRRGDRPGVYWEVDFTEIKAGKYGNKYLLVFVDTFSGWVEAFPTKSETAQVVAKKILEEILPRFGVPKVIGSDNGPAFVAQVSQGLASQLGTD